MPDCCWLAVCRRAPTRTCWSSSCCCGWSQQSAVPAWSREAVARLAVLQAESKRPHEALRYYERLAGELADQVCLDGKTGKQLVDELWPADSPLRAQLERTPVWPVGVVDVKPLQPAPAPRTATPCSISSASEPLSDLRLELVQQTSTLLARDGLGRKLWTLPLREATAQRVIYDVLSQSVRKPACAATSWRVAMQEPGLSPVDALGDGKGNPRLLWKQNLVETIPGLSTANAENAGEPDLHARHGLRQRLRVHDARAGTGHQPPGLLPTRAQPRGPGRPHRARHSGCGTTSPAEHAVRRRRVHLLRPARCGRPADARLPRRPTASSWASGTFPPASRSPARRKRGS